MDHADKGVLPGNVLARVPPRKQIRKSTKAKKPLIANEKGLKTIKNSLLASESSSKGKLKDKDVPVGAWAVPQKLHGMKSQKKGQLAPLNLKKRQSLEPTPSRSPTTGNKSKQQDEVVEVEYAEEVESVVSKMDSYLSLVSEQERRAKAHFVAVTILKYSDQSTILDRLYNPNTPILELKKDILHILGGGDAEVPQDYDPDETQQQSLEGLDHMVLRIGDVSVTASSRDKAIRAARDTLTLSETWYTTPPGVKAKHQEQLKIAQRRIGHLNMAARKRNMNKGRGPLTFGATPAKPVIKKEEEAVTAGHDKGAESWASEESDEFSADAIEARRKRLLLYCEVWELDDDHDHLLEVVKTFGSDRNDQDNGSEKSGYHNINDFIVNKSRVPSASPTDSKGRDINTWVQSDWDRRLASEWQPDEKYEEDASLSSIKQADRLIARARALRHAQSLEKRRLNMLLKDIQSWHGILVLDCRVTKIHLAHLRPPLTGHLDQPSHVELGLLTGLIRINLGNNKLVGKIPGKSLRRLLNLTSLNLSHNQFTGTIPCDDLGYLTALTDLRLGANRLTGTVQPSLCHCSLLKTLDLSSNYLEGEIPEQIGGLTQLLVLNLGRNSFTGWLKKWIGMASVQRLSLQHNHLRGALPESLGRLFRCEYLHLNDNRFDGELDVNILSAMHYGVREIHLQGNRFFDDDTEKNFQAAEQDDSSFQDDDASQESESSRRRVKLLEAKAELEEMFPECSVLI